MLNRKDRQERGQAILLMAVALIGMLGFAAVALDGGNIYSEQRRAQSAADNAALAAAYQYMKGVTSSTTINNAALANALSNDYDNNSTSNWVKFYRPPITGVYAGNNAYMQVVITERVPTALAHLVYQGPFQLTVSAIAYAKRGGPPVDGNAVVALTKTGCSIVKANGNGDLVVTGGGIFANSDGTGTGCGGGATVVDASGGGSSITVNDPYKINVVDSTHPAGGTGDIDPSPVNSGVEQITTDPMADLDPPSCATGPNTSPSGSSTGQWISPGTYNTLQVASNKILYLQPGLYCVTSANNSAVDVGASGVLSGTGVTIYLQYGGMQITQGLLDLKGPTTTYNPACASVVSWEAPTSSICHYLGIVFYVDRNNTQDIKLAGGTGWDIEGTIYAPASSVELDGNGDWSMTGQVLSNNVVSGGGGDMNVIFDPNIIYVPPPSVSLMQ